ncbi:hypothetical protein HanIR_Chr09g0448161 [Helianthus annuus]|nr:hypothetical protein HanIR_Chr09g0448161 [Helianthus annuus]
MLFELIHMVSPQKPVYKIKEKKNKKINLSTRTLTRIKILFPNVSNLCSIIIFFFKPVPWHMVMQNTFQQLFLYKRRFFLSLQLVVQLSNY